MPGRRSEYDDGNNKYMHISVYVTGDLSTLCPTLKEIPAVIQFSSTLVKVMGFLLLMCIKFLMAVVTNYHKLGLNNKKQMFSLSSGGQMSEIRVTQTQGAPSKGSRGDSLSCSFQPLVAACAPWLVAASLISLLPREHYLLFCVKCSSSSLLWAPLWLYIGPTKIMQNNILKSLNLITSTKTLCPYKATITVPGNKFDVFEGHNPAFYNVFIS